MTQPTISEEWDTLVTEGEWTIRRPPITPAQLVTLVEDLRDYLDQHVLEDTGVLELVDPAHLTYLDGSPVAAVLDVFWTETDSHVRHRDGRVGELEATTASGEVITECHVRFPGPVQPLLDRCNAALPALRALVAHPMMVATFPVPSQEAVDSVRRAVGTWGSSGYLMILPPDEMRSIAREVAARENTPCPRCANDGYLDESTQSDPIYCTCSNGIAAWIRDSGPGRPAMPHELEEAAKAFTLSPWSNQGLSMFDTTDEIEL